METINELFYETKYYKAPRKESLAELRDCYEKYTHSYISRTDFIILLKQLGFQSNKDNVFKLRMRKNIHKLYYDNKIGK
jgi:hypothetical protein